MAGVPKPLTDEEIGARPAKLPQWTRVGDEITRMVEIRCHAGVAVIVHVADRERRIGHHADIDLRIDHIKFAITTRGAGHKLTAADFDLAARIDAIETAHLSTPRQRTWTPPPNSTAAHARRSAGKPQPSA